MEPQTRDSNLVRDAQAGSPAAYGELVRIWSARVLGFCHAKAGRAGLAEDLAQETFLRGFRFLPGLKDPERFGSWLCGIAVRTLLDWRKSKQASQVPLSGIGSSAGEALEGEASPEGPEREEERRRVLASVEALPEIYREVVMLFYYEEMKYQEIADLLGLSAAAVNARLTKARAMLRERLSRSRSG